MKVAVPRFGEDIAPCFEYSATITIFTFRGKKIVDVTDFTLQSRDALDRFRLLRDQQVKTLICGGLQDYFEDLLKANGINVISWVSGNVEKLLERFIEGRLVSNPRSLFAGSTGSEFPASNK